METIYLCIIIFLFVLAVFDLIVGVSNDAVNFLNSAVGAKAASFKTILFIAGIGIFIGASLSNGMMDIARHGIYQPEHFYFAEIMCILLAVMLTDVVLLDVFNSMGMPTSTTVSLVFELLDAIQKGEFSDVAEDITYLIQQCRKKLENNDYQNMEEEIRRANDLNGQLSQLKRKELQRIQSQSGSIRVSMVYLTMVQEAQNVVTYIINLMKVSRKFQMET